MAMTLSEKETDDIDDETIRPELDAYCQSIEANANHQRMLLCLAALASRAVETATPGEPLAIDAEDIADILDAAGTALDQGILCEVAETLRAE